MTTDRAREAFQHWYIAYQRNWCKSEGEAPDSLVAWEAWNAARADMAEELVKSMKARTGGIPSPAEADYDDYRWGYDSAMRDAIDIIREELAGDVSTRKDEILTSDSSITSPAPLSLKARKKVIDRLAEALGYPYEYAVRVFNTIEQAGFRISKELAGGNLERHEPEPSDSGVTNPGQLGDALNTAPPAPPLTADGGNYEWPKDAGGGGGGT